MSNPTSAGVVSRLCRECGAPIYAGSLPVHQSCSPEMDGQLALFDVPGEDRLVEPGRG